MKNGYTIGIDMGVNNVGWSILDNEKEELINYGVRLFNPSNDAKTRRECRNTRRGKRREDTRVNDLKKLLKNINFPEEIIIDVNLLEKRCKGINEALEKQDITNILIYMLCNRGYIPFGDNDNTESYVELKNNMLPCFYYYDIYKKTGRYHDINKTVRNTDNIREIKALLTNQSKYYKEITEDFINDVITIFTRKRKFFEGPGSVNSLTPYGRFKTEEDVEIYLENKKINPNYEKYLFEDLIGNCKYYIDEKCVPKLNKYQEIFNLLNDFINISFKSIDEVSNKNLFYQSKNEYYKLNKEGLLKVLSYAEEHPKLKVPDIFKDLFSTTLDNVTGYRIDRNKKYEFATLNNYRKVLNEFTKNNFDTSWIKDIDTYNKVIYIMTITPGANEFTNMIKSSDVPYKFNDNEISLLNELKIKFNKAFLLSYSNMSQKILERSINDMTNLAMNFMQVSRLKNYDKEAKKYFISKYQSTSSKGYKISKIFIDDIIASPQVKKSLRQAIDVINAIIEKYGLPKNIVIESTKELNSKDKRLEIEKLQKQNEVKRKRAEEIISKTFGEDMVTEKNIIKMMLYEETNGSCMYCNKPININDIINENYEIEHILPLSKSFNDSFENKTIACQKCNHEKGNKTAYQFLINNIKDFQERVNANNNLSEDKKENLLFSEDINKYTLRFFNRNLRDTAYATTELIKQINLFNDYLETIDKDKKIKTLSIPGWITHNIRKKNNLDKDRDDGKYHHAVDASIVASLTTTKIGEIMLEAQNDKKFWIKNSEGFEDKNEYLKKVNIKKTIEQIKKINNENTKLSSQVLQNPNKQLANQNIIKYIMKDNGYYKISQINDIYNLSNEDMKLLDKLFSQPTKQTLLCYDKDRATYLYLKEIYEKYKDMKGNPFINYIKDKEGIENFDIQTNGIRAVSKNNNGPIIKRLRYYQKVTSPYLLNKKNINKKDTTYIGLDSLAQYCTKVYKDNIKNEFVFLPVYSISVNLKTKIINENDSYYKLFFDKYLKNKDVTYITTLFNGNVIEVYKEDGSIIKGVISSFDKYAERIQIKNSNIRFVKKDRALTVYDVDVLGNEKKRLTYTIK
mgnify:FL=1